MFRNIITLKKKFYEVLNRPPMQSVKRILLTIVSKIVVDSGAFSLAVLFKLEVMLSILLYRSINLYKYLLKCIT